MSQDETSSHVQTLLDQSHKLLVEGKFEDAASALRTASTVAPNNEQVKTAWDKLRSSDSKPNFVSLCKEFNLHQDEGKRDRVINAAKSGDCSEQDMTDGLAELLSHKNAETVDARDAVVASVCANNNGGTALAKFLHERPTETFRDVWRLGDKSIDGLIHVFANKAWWSNEDYRTAAVVDVFILLLAKLLDINLQTPLIAVRCLAKLMAADASILESSIDAENFEIILNFIDVERPVEVRSQATLIVAKFLEVSPERGQSMLKDYVITRFSKKSNSNDDIVSAVSVAGAIFPIVPSFAASMFLTDGFSKELLRILSKTRSTRLRLAGLELLSASCIDKDCREQIRQDCWSWLQGVVQGKGEASEIAMAALVLSKIRPGASGDVAASNNKPDDNATNELIPLLRELSMHNGKPEMQTSVEALAYSSIDSAVKEKLANDLDFLKNLIKELLEPSNRGPLLFGGLTILSNLATYPPLLSAESKRMAQLKAYANQTKFAEPSVLDNDAHVTARCKRILDAGAVPMLVRATRQASNVTLGLISNIFLSLSKQRTHCGPMVQQGALDSSLKLLQLDPKDATETIKQARKHAAQAIARLAIPLDPKLLFSKNEGLVNWCVAALKYLLGLVDDQDPFVVFDALRALTNIATYNEVSCQLIVDSCKDEIVAYLGSNRSAIQQAATECICNLTQHLYPALEILVVPVNKQPYDPFPADFDVDIPGDDKRPATFMRIVHLTSEKVRGTRLAAMASLASVTSFEDGLQMLLRAPHGLEHVVAALEDAQSVESGEAIGLKGKAANVGDMDMRMRVITVLNNVSGLLDDSRDIHRRLHDLGATSVIEAGLANLPAEKGVQEIIIELTTQITDALKTSELM